MAVLYTLENRNDSLFPAFTFFITMADLIRSNKPLSEDEFKALLVELVQEMFVSGMEIEWDVHHAADISQQALLQALEKREQLSAPEKLRGWLGTIRRRVRIRESRKIKREKERIEKYCYENRPEVNALIYNPESRLEESEEREKESKLLKEGYQSLPIELRQVFVRYFRRGMSKEEIAEELQISIKTVDNRLRRIKGRLSDYMRRMIVAYMTFELSRIDSKAVAAQIVERTLQTQAGGSIAATTSSATTGSASSVAAKSSGFTMTSSLAFLGVHFACLFSLLLGGQVFGEYVTRNAPTLRARRWFVRQYLLWYCWLVLMPLIHGVSVLTLVIGLQFSLLDYRHFYIYAEILCFSGISIAFVVWVVTAFYANQTLPENDQADGGLIGLQAFVRRGLVFCVISLLGVFVIWCLVIISSNVGTLFRPEANLTKFGFLMGIGLLFFVFLSVVHTSYILCFRRLMELAGDESSLNSSDSDQPEKRPGKLFDELGFVIPFALVPIFFNTSHLLHIQSHPFFSMMEIVAWSFWWSIVLRSNIRDTRYRWSRILVSIVLQLFVIALLRFMLYE